MVDKLTPDEAKIESDELSIELMETDEKANQVTRGTEGYLVKGILLLAAIPVALYFALNGYLTITLGAIFVAGILRALIRRKPLFLVAGYAVGLAILLGTPFYTAMNQLDGNPRFEHLAGFDAQLRRDEDRIAKEAKVFEELFEEGRLGVYWAKTEPTKMTPDQAWYIRGGLNPAQKYLAPEGLAEKGALNVEPLALSKRSSKIVTLVDMNVRARMDGPVSEVGMPFVTATCYIGASDEVLMATSVGPAKMLDSSAYEALAPIQRICERMAAGENVPSMREVRPRQ